MVKCLWWSTNRVLFFFPADIMKSGSKQILSTPTGILHFMAFLISPLCILSHFSCVQLCVTLWTVARQAPLSMGFSRQQYWNGLPCPPPGYFPNPGIEPVSLAAPASEADSSPLCPLWSPLSSLKACCLWGDTDAYIRVSLRVTVIKYNCNLLVKFLINSYQYGS